MKKTALVLVLTAILGGAAFFYSSGISMAWVLHGPSVATGIGAKLLCSAEYVIGAPRDSAYRDMTQYSPTLERLTITYNEPDNSVTADFMGIDEKTATFLPGLGCAIDFDTVDGRGPIETRPLPASSAPWPAGDTVATIDPGLQALVDEIVSEDNAHGLNTRAMLVVHGAHIVAEGYAQNTTPQTPLLGWSMAKSMTAIMLGNLALTGRLDLQAPPGFPAWENDERSAIRIVDLLTMTDGLDFSEQYNPGDDATAMLFTEPSAADYALSRPVAHPPGTYFSYSSGTANLLARLYVDTLGGSQAAYDHLYRDILIPMGFQHAVFEMDASGTFVGSSYLYASARDWARMGELMRNEGQINGQRIVSPEWVRQATTPNGSGNDRAYGYQWWLNSGNNSLRYPSLPADAYFASGNRAQTVMVLPSDSTVIVRLGWTAGRYPGDRQFSRILAAVQSR